MAPLTLYFLRPSPPCRAVLLTAKIIGVDLKLETTDLFGKKDHLQPSYLKMNPAHTIPTLDDNGFYLWESRAIMTYLIQQYGKDDKLYPKDPKKRARIDQMLYFDASTAYASVARYFMNYLAYGREPTAEELEKIKSNIAVLDDILSKSTYAAGAELSLADLSLLTTVTCLDSLEIDYSDRKHVTKWVNKLKTQLGSHYTDAIEPGLNDFKGFIKSKKAEIGKK